MRVATDDGRHLGSAEANAFHEACAEPALAAFELRALDSPNGAQR